MDKNLNLTDYWTKSPPLLLAIFLMIAVLIGAVLNRNSDQSESQIVIGVSLDSEERVREGEKVKFLLVELDGGSEILVSLPFREEVQIGANVKLVKNKSGYPGSSREALNKSQNRTLCCSSTL